MGGNLESYLKKIDANFADSSSESTWPNIFESPYYSSGCPKGPMIQCST